MKTRILSALLALALGTAAHAQQQPLTANVLGQVQMPPTSVLGNALSVTSGLNAIPFANFTAGLFGSIAGDLTCNSSTGLCTIANGAITSAKIGTNAVANSNLVVMSAGTVKANPTGATGTATDTVSPVLGGGGVGGSLALNGSTSGSIVVQPQAVAGSYNFNLPTTAGTSGQPLLSGGGGSAAMTFGTLGVAAGGTGDTGTAWTNFTPSFACASGTWTVNSARSKTLGKTTWVEFDVTLGAAACTGATTFTLPNTSNSTGTVNGQEAVSGTMSGCRFLGVGTTATCIPNGGGNFGANSHLVASGVYENQ